MKERSDREGAPCVWREQQVSVVLLTEIEETWGRTFESQRPVEPDVEFFWERVGMGIILSFSVRSKFLGVWRRQRRERKSEKIAFAALHAVGGGRVPKLAQVLSSFFWMARTRLSQPEVLD